MTAKASHIVYPKPKPVAVIIKCCRGDSTLIFVTAALTFDFCKFRSFERACGVHRSPWGSENHTGHSRKLSSLDSLAFKCHL